jgi:hypothetical protein
MYRVLVVADDSAIVLLDLQTPLVEEDLLLAIRQALAGHPGHARRPVLLPAAEPHAHLRLAYKAVEFISSPNDAPTLYKFGRAVGVSAGGFRSWCRAGGVRPRAYLQLARALRVVYRREANPLESLENLLEIVDRRTLEKFVVASGGHHAAMPLTVEALLSVQRLVRPEIVAAIRVALAKAAYPAGAGPKTEEGKASRHAG